MMFPSCIKRIILCFVYLDDHQPTFVYPSLEEENFQPLYVVDVDLISSPQPAHKDELCIQIIYEFDQPCNVEETKTDSKPPQTSAPYAIISEPCHQPVNSNVQTTTFQTKIINKSFKPLRLPYHLNPYPPNFFEYLPWFSGEDNVSAEKHLECFHNFNDNFEIVHEDVVLRLFSKYLVGDVALWCKNIEAISIDSWADLYNTFSRSWGENKSLDQYLTDFHTFRRGEEKYLVAFNKRLMPWYIMLWLNIQILFFSC